MLLPGLRGVADTPGTLAGRTRSGGSLLAAVVAGAVVALDVAGTRSTAAAPRGGGGRARGRAGARSDRCCRPGTLRRRRGLPSVIALRGVIAATFFATEIYLPYLLQEQYDVPAWLSGATLTVGALGWAGASQVQARLGARLDHAAALRVGAVLLLGGIAGRARRHGAAG